MQTNTEISKYLNSFLRHKIKDIANRGEITIDENGFVNFNDLLKFATESKKYTKEDFLTVINNDSKRFELKGDNIRAVFGHSFKLENKNFTTGVKYIPKALFYVVKNKNNIDNILNNGLSPTRGRNCLFFSQVASYSFYNLKVDVDSMIKDGYIFEKYENGLIGVEGNVDKKYIYT